MHAKSRAKRGLEGRLEGRPQERLTKEDEGRTYEGPSEASHGGSRGLASQESANYNVMAAFITFHPNTADIHMNARAKRTRRGSGRRDPPGGVKATASKTVLSRFSTISTLSYKTKCSNLID
jgi:hypothetical protein